MHYEEKNLYHVLSHILKLVSILSPLIISPSLCFLLCHCFSEFFVEFYFFFRFSFYIAFLLLPAAESLFFFFASSLLTAHLVKWKVFTIIFQWSLYVSLHIYLRLIPFSFVLSNHISTAEFSKVIFIKPNSFFSIPYSFLLCSLPMILMIQLLIWSSV